LIDRLIISYLKYIHGLYNILVILLFLYQGWIGLRIRRERIRGTAPTVKIIKRHRRFGPILSLLGISGFFAGLTVVYLDEGHFFEHPLHFIIGLVIILLVIATFSISRRIRGRDSHWRTPHFALGVIIICLYLFQAFLGIGILF